MNLEALERFKGLEVKLTKVESKRSNRSVDIGHRTTGELSFIEYPATDTYTEGVGVVVSGRGFSYLRTSPIVDIIDFTESTVTFETEGGVYLLERQYEV